MTETKGIHGLWLIVALLLFAGLMLWGYLDAHNYFPHEKLARITRTAWDGNAKNCDEWNSAADLPVLECDGGHADVQETVRVRFYGNTHVDLQGDTLRLHWRCEQTTSPRASVTCRIESVN